MARRLLVPVTLLFLVLLVLGSLVPTDSTQTDTSTTPLPPPDMRPTRTIEATLPGKDVRAQVGDLVTLTVESDVPGGVEMPAFGESAPVAPHAPAMFDVLPTQPGRYVVQNMQTGKPIGVLVVDDAPPGDHPGADPS